MGNGSSSTTGRGGSTGPGNVWARVLLLALFVLAMNSWAARHFGQERLHRWVANGPLLLIAIASFVWEVLKKEETGKFVVRMKGWFVFLLRTPVLTILYGIFLLAGSVISSVTVMASGAPEKMSVRLAPEGRPQCEEALGELNGPDDVVRVMRFTAPFGRPHYLDVDGHLRHFFDLYPWVGERIRVPRDLRVSPSVLIRVPFEAIRHLEKGKIEVAWKGKPIVEAETRIGQGSVIVGHYQQIPNEFADKWRMELLAQGVKGDPLYSCLSDWQQPGPVSSSVPLAPGMALEAEFFIKRGQTIARSEFWVGSEKIQDVLLLKEKER